MISESKLQELLHDNVPESETIDFKSEAYRLVNEDLKSRFIKDVLSMANTPREGTSYIVIGIKLNPDGTKARIGVQGNHPDDADLQKCLNLAGLQPKPIFSYQPITLAGLSYGVVAIPVTNEGPYIPTKKYGLLLPSVLYFRRGSGNDEADANDLTRIVSWFYQRRVAMKHAPASIQNNYNAPIQGGINNVTGDHPKIEQTFHFGALQKKDLDREG